MKRSTEGISHRAHHHHHEKKTFSSRTKKSQIFQHTKVGSRKDIVLKKKIVTRPTAKGENKLVNQDKRVAIPKAVDRDDDGTAELLQRAQNTNLSKNEIESEIDNILKNTEPTATSSKPTISKHKSKQKSKQKSKDKLKDKVKTSTDNHRSTAKIHNGKGAVVKSNKVLSGNKSKTVHSTTPTTLSHSKVSNSNVHKSTLSKINHISQQQQHNLISTTTGPANNASTLETKSSPHSSIITVNKKGLTAGGRKLVVTEDTLALQQQPAMNDSDGEAVKYLKVSLFLDKSKIIILVKKKLKPTYTNRFLIKLKFILKHIILTYPLTH